MPAAPSHTSTRLVSLDVFRGLVIASMILVENPGWRAHTYAQLEHAAWFGATCTDMIFPSFLFMVGLAIPYSFASRLAHGADRVKLALRVLRRSIILILLGIALNGFPDYHWHTLRFPGVLQRIGVCYFVCSIVYLLVTRSREDTETSSRTILIASLAVAAIAVYWALLKLVPVPGIGAGHLDSYGNLPAYIDRHIFGLNHMWAWGLTSGRGVTYDPEGLLSTLPSLFNTFAGILTADWLRSRRSAKTKALGITFSGIALISIGLALSPLMPLNKRIWTSTFSLFTVGVSLTVFAALYFLIDLRRHRRGLTPFLVLGMNAILAYVISNILEILIGRHFIQIGSAPTMRTWLFSHFFAWLPPAPSSLAYAILMVLVNIAILYPLYRKRIFVKI
jgi:predicted acyltransferase